MDGGILGAIEEVAAQEGDGVPDREVAPSQPFKQNMVHYMLEKAGAPRRLSSEKRR